MRPIRRASASRSPPTSAWPIRAPPPRRPTGFCVEATIIRVGCPPPASSTWVCCSSAFSRTWPQAFSPCKRASTASSSRSTSSRLAVGISSSCRASGRTTISSPKVSCARRLRPDASSTPGPRLGVRPFDDPVRPMFGGKVALAGRHPPAHRNARLVHAVGRARHQRMPVVEGPSLGDQPISAGDGKPAKLANRGRRQLHAVENLPVTVLIIAAAAGPAVKQPAANVREVNLARILVFELGEAAAATAVTEAFPFGQGHLVERLGPPERLGLLVLRCQTLRPVKRRERRHA